jgi:hypothetical protein
MASRRLSVLKSISSRVLMMKVEDAVKVEPVDEFVLKGIRRPLAAYNVVAALTWTERVDGLPSSVRMRSVKSRDDRDKWFVEPPAQTAARPLQPLLAAFGVR